ncbi:MAG TPA: glycosyltransferase family 1 protein [Acidobacteria bacterium]|nr:glycosyltransferase family 1 protein [Acidobacteriota bacterium]
MRIAIDVRKLHDYGIGTYIRNLVTHLHRLDSTTEYILLCKPDDQTFASGLGENFRLVSQPAGPYSISEQIRIPIQLKREAIDLFHAPHYTLPALTPCRSIVTIHDCIHLRFPQYLPNRLAHGYARAALWTATHRSDRVLTVSEASKQDILTFFDIPADKITVIPNAIDDCFFVPPPDKNIERIRERYQLQAPFLLYVGNVHPHKNLERLLDAFYKVRSLGHDDLTLLIIGDDITRYAKLRRAVHRYQLHRYVRFLGFVPNETLRVLYHLARAFVFPSLYEGFGLPPLEAMASGTAVVTSNVSSLPEVTGDAAILVDPHSQDAIAGGICRVLEDNVFREELVTKGQARAKQFSWDRSIQHTLEIYRETLLSNQRLSTPPGKTSA